MARIAKVHVHFVETHVEVQRESWGAATGTTFRDYNVEERQGQVRRTIGRIFGAINSSGGSWEALPIGATAWTARHTTRREALAALYRREDFRAVAS